MSWRHEVTHWKGFDIVLISVMPDKTFQKQKNLKAILNAWESNRFLKISVLWQGEFYYTIRLPVLISSNLKNYFFQRAAVKTSEKGRAWTYWWVHTLVAFPISQIYSVTGKRQKMWAQMALHFSLYSTGFLQGRKFLLWHGSSNQMPQALWGSFQ